ncbi:MAG: GNAT family protein [Actinomycetota bacterium]
MKTPVLSDGVVVLRAWTADDAAFMYSASKDPLIQRYNGPVPHSIVEAEAVIGRIADSWRTFAAHGDPTGAAFAIVEVASDEVIGMCGVDGWSETDAAQFGYWLATNGRGSGSATRAATLMTSWLFDLRAARVFLHVNTDNDASAAVARRVGFTYEATLRSFGTWRGRPTDVDVFAIRRSEWRSTRHRGPHAM